MNEPQKRKLSEFTSEKKEPKKIRMEPNNTNIQELYDDFGYITTIEIKNEDNCKNNS